MKKILFGALAITLMLGMAMVGCDNGSKTKEFTVKFDLDGGTYKGETTKSDEKVKENTAIGDKLPLATDMAKVGSTFTEWQDKDSNEPYTAATSVTKDVTLIAIWGSGSGATSHRVTIDLQGGKYGVGAEKSADNPVVDTTGTTNANQRVPAAYFTAANYAKDDSETHQYTFRGLFDAATGGTAFTATTNVAAARTVYVQWNEQEKQSATDWRVNLDPNGGTITSTLSGSYYIDVAKGSAIAAEPALAERSGYEFDGWRLATVTGEKIEFPYTPSDNVTLVAAWTSTSAPTVTITFNAGEGAFTDGASGEKTIQIAIGGAIMPDEFPAVAKEGSLLDAWYDGDTKVEAGDPEDASEGTKFSDNTTLTARYLSPELTWDDSDGFVERVSSENNSYAIYEFDLGSAAFSSYSGLTATYKVSEVTIGMAADSVPEAQRTNVRAVRVYGDYALDDDMTASQTRSPIKYDANVTSAHGGNVFFLDSNQYNTPRYQWVVSRAPDGQGWHNLNGGSAVVGNEWFTVTYTLGEFTGAAADPNNKPAADKTGKIYLGINIAGNGGPGRMVTQLIKDVALTGTGAGVIGKAVYCEDTVNGKDQAGLFMSYKNDGDYVHASREIVQGGELGETYVVRDVDTGALPKDCGCHGDKTVCDCEEDGGTCDCDLCEEPKGPIVPADDPLEVTDVDALELHVYGNSSTTAVIAVDGNKATVKVTSGDGRGFWFNIPNEWESYETIEIHYNLTVNNGNRAAIIVKGGADSWNYDYNDGQYSQYKVLDNTGVMVLDLTKFPDIPNKPTQGGAGISFQLNNSDATDQDQDWEFELTKLRLLPADWEN